MMMNGRKFMTGLGIGMVAGGALCMMMAPKAKRNDGKRMVSRALKGMGDVIDDVSDALLRCPAGPSSAAAGRPPETRRAVRS